MSFDVLWNFPALAAFYDIPWPVNLGTITNAINVLNVGAAYKF